VAASNTMESWVSAYLVTATAVLGYLPYLAAILMPSKYWLKVYAFVAVLALLGILVDQALHSGADVNPLVSVVGLLVGLFLI
jgi:hypothetical protein